MTHQVTDREILEDLAAQPIGSPELQREAERCGQHLKPPPALREAAKRCNKIWLPGGKKPRVTAEEKAREKQIRSAQIDIEDAVEAAGGERGSAKA